MSLEQINLHLKQDHYSYRSTLLRACILGGVDGLITTTSIMLGTSKISDYNNLILIGIATVFAGAFSMSCGEYISVSSQKEIELQDIEKEKRQHELNPELELQELIEIYKRKGLSDNLAIEVGTKLNSVDIHLKEELNIDPNNLSNPYKAAFGSLISFALGGLIPLLITIISKQCNLELKYNTIIIVICSLSSLILLGILAGYLGGLRSIKILYSSIKFLIGGILALSVTYLSTYFLN